jgi:hypothetical protein
MKWGRTSGVGKALTNRDVGSPVGQGAPKRTEFQKFVLIFFSDFEPV